MTHRSRARTWTLIVLAAVLLAAAVVLIVRGFSETGGSVTAPVPASAFSSAALPDGTLPPFPTAAPAGPDVGTVAPEHFSRSDRPPAEQVPDGPVLDGHLVIPVLGVDAAVVSEPLDEDNSLILPTDVNRVTRWSGSAAQDSAAGTVLVAGHVDNAAQGQGALYWIHTLAAGDVIFLAEGGLVTRWQVTGLEAVHKAALPDRVWAGPDGPRQLILVTCGGQFLRDADGRGHYEDNVIVTAVPE